MVNVEKNQNGMIAQMIERELSYIIKKNLGKKKDGIDFKNLMKTIIL